MGGRQGRRRPGRKRVPELAVVVSVILAIGWLPTVVPYGYDKHEALGSGAATLLLIAAVLVVFRRR